MLAKIECTNCPVVNILKKIESADRQLKKLEKKKRDPNFKEGKFLQYTLLFEN